MEKAWFRKRKYGYGWGLPQTWQGWVIFLLYIAFIPYDFVSIDSTSHSVSDTLINFIPNMFLATVIFIAIAFITSGKPEWHFGETENGKRN